MRGLLLVALLLDPRPTGVVTRGDPRNPAIFPEQELRIRFDHSVHLGDVGLGCMDCHSSVRDSTRTKDFNVPPRAKCLECHDDAEIPARWDAHGRPDVVMPPAHLKFSHASHLGRGEVKCGTCHEGVGKATLATRDHLPSMETCLTCHDGAKASNACKTCHLAGSGGTIRTAFASGSLVPDDHGPLFLRQHEIDAERGLAYCASCHAQTDCLSCHDGAIPPTFHDADYLATHPQEALADDPACASCHRLERFCRDCHFRANVTLGGPLAFGDFHPEGWLGTMNPLHHAHVARKNVASCASCHAEQDCISCHAFYVGAPRTHPLGFGGSTRARRLRDANPALCLKCHVLGDPNDPINGP